MTCKWLPYMNTSLDLSSLRLMYNIPLKGDTRNLFHHLYLWYIEHLRFPVIKFRVLVQRFTPDQYISNGTYIHTPLIEYLINHYKDKPITDAVQFHYYYQVISEIELFVPEADQLIILSRLQEKYK